MDEKLTKNNLINRFINLNEKTNVYLEKVSMILEELNDQNKLHTEAIKVNTQATKEMTKSFNKIWLILWIVILALVVLAGAEKILKFI